jgi:ketosteroid isomerase-like protein
MTRNSGVEIVQTFWKRVWQGQDFDAIDELVVDDFVLVTGGERIESREAFKAWAKGFGAAVGDFRFEVLETFQNEDGSRVASLWRVTGRNNGAFGTEPDNAPIEMTGTAVWDVREDGMLLCNRVERNAFEVYQRLARGQGA